MRARRRRVDVSGPRHQRRRRRRVRRRPGRVILLAKGRTTHAAPQLPLCGGEIESERRSSALSVRYRRQFYPYYLRQVILRDCPIYYTMVSF